MAVVTVKFQQPDGTPFRNVIGGGVVNLDDWSFTEEATPLTPGDTSGATASGSVSCDAGVNAKYASGRTMVVSDEWYGATSLIASNPTVVDSKATFTGDSPLMRLTVKKKVAARSGFVGDVVQQYLVAAGVKASIIDVDARLQAAPYARTFPGWHDDIWTKLKELCTVAQVEILPRNGRIAVQPVRQNQLKSPMISTETWSTSTGQLGQFVEVYNYNHKAITNTLVYPPGVTNEETKITNQDGWSTDVSVLSVAVNEVTKEDVQINAYLTSVVQPVCVKYVTSGDNSASQYTVMGNGRVETMDPAVWAAHGGSVKVTIDQDDASLLHIEVNAGSNEPSLSPYRICATGANDYSTLRIIGTGMHFQKELIRVPTGLTVADTPNEVAITVDTPFIGTLEDAYKAAARALSACATIVPSLSLTSARFFDIGTGFGFVAGARIIRDGGNFRARTAAFTPATGIAVTADADSTFADLSAIFAGKKFSDFTALWASNIFRDIIATPLRKP